MLRAASLCPLLLALSLATSAGCRGIAPPYAPGDSPDPEAVLAAGAPVLTTLQVPRAKVRQGGGPQANLMLVAQAPARFSGTIQVSGNELATLAVNELEYGLRWVGGRDDGRSLAPGYYSGPPSRCAVGALLGVDLEPETFVDLVLGGAPMIDAPYEVLDRRWDRKQGRELVTVANDRFEQELAYAWSGAAWQFAGASLWQREADGSRRWLWSVSHEELHEIDGALLPKKTEIRRPKPGKRGEVVLHITFLKQVANPSFGAASSSSEPPVAGDSEDPPNAGDSWDDDWDDEDEATGGASGDGDEADQVDEAEAIPAAFVGNPTGLTVRGDLCAGR